MKKIICKIPVGCEINEAVNILSAIRDDINIGEETGIVDYEDGYFVILRMGEEE